ncbi:MAG TPA: response regulator [Bacteroidia bacterium]|jgi:two-component system response regulator LytT|nr:response regulator [Bacteroidia bacterium]HTA63193.1 response regulator [Bacteroidia bacterium]HXD91972.1 response regulator [Bacteroidia bacterium]
MSNTINILVVEDESIVSKDIQNSLKKIGYNVIGSCNNAEEAIEIATELHPDVVLMDIMLKGTLTGIDAADKIKLLNIPVIFLTAYADEATLAKAKVTEPYGYILKPFKEKDLNISIEMAIHRHKKLTELRKERDFLYSIVENKEGAKDVLFVKSNSRLVKINTKDIFFIEALKDYVTINTELMRYTIHSTMKDIEKKVAPNEFMRVHRSFIVRVDKIVAIENHNLILEKDKKPIPIGGSYKDELLQRLNMV